MIITKARAIRIGARLPAELWPEAVKTAGYLTNRSPSSSLSWKTPLEVLQLATGITNPQPKIAHLRVYGCRAYALNPRIPRTQKLEPRAHIGYLVGYDSTNIFRIWIPSIQRIISTRDVTFDESLFYDPNVPDLAKQLKVHIDQIIDLVEISHPSSLLDQDLALDTNSDTEDELSEMFDAHTDTAEDIENRTLSNQLRSRYDQESTTSSVMMERNRLTPSSSRDIPLNQNPPLYLTPRETPKSMPEAPPVGETQSLTTNPIQLILQESSRAGNDSTVTSFHHLHGHGKTFPNTLTDTDFGLQPLRNTKI